MGFYTFRRSLAKAVSTFLMPQSKFQKVNLLKMTVTQKLAIVEKERRNHY